jgi:hypothetical protein
MEPLTEKYGSKIAMLFSIGASSLYYLGITHADNLLMLYIFTLPTIF